MPTFYQLNEDTPYFPLPPDDEEVEATAVGDDLSPQRLMCAYSTGYFPWYPYKHCEEILWYCPTKRFVIFPDEIHVSHSMRQLMKKDTYRVTFDSDFDGVIHHCAEAQGRNTEEEAWLGPDIMRAYRRLHELKRAASVEVWEGERLVGGLYGVVGQRAFFGESMFSLVPSASKLALIHLAKKAKEMGWKFIDCQLETPHLRSMGGRTITYDEYMTLLHGDTYTQIKR